MKTVILYSIFSDYCWSGDFKMLMYFQIIVGVVILNTSSDMDRPVLILLGTLHGSVMI